MKALPASSAYLPDVRRALANAPAGLTVCELGLALRWPRHKARRVLSRVAAGGAVVGTAEGNKLRYRLPGVARA